MIINNVTDATNAQNLAFNARLVRNLNVANKPEVKRVMEVAQDFFEKTAKKYPDLELRMYQEPDDLFTTMSLFNIKDRFIGDAKGHFRVESLIEDSPSDKTLVNRLKKLITYLRKDDELMRLSDEELSKGKGLSILEQMTKIAGNDKVLLENLDVVRLFAK